MRIKNIFTGNVYEVVKYVGYKENVHEVIDFIKEKHKYNVRVIQPTLHVADIEVCDFTSEINEGDYVIRTDAKAPLYNIINQEIFNNNFTVIE